MCYIYNSTYESILKTYGSLILNREEDFKFNGKYNSACMPFFKVEWYEDNLPFCSSEWVFGHLKDSKKMRCSIFQVLQRR